MPNFPKWRSRGATQPSAPLESTKKETPSASPGKPAVSDKWSADAVGKSAHAKTRKAELKQPSKRARLNQAFTGKVSLYTQALSSIQATDFFSDDPAHLLKALNDIDAWGAKHQASNKKPKQKKQEAIAEKRNELLTRLQEVSPGTAQRYTVQRALEQDVASARVQNAVSNGQVKFTAGDKPGGSSGSYFVGDGVTGKAYVFKPAGQEADIAGRLRGQNAVSEVLACRLADHVLASTGLDLGVPATGLANLESQYFSQFGDPMVRGPNDYPADVGAAQQVGSLQQCVRVDRNAKEYFETKPDLTSEKLSSALAQRGVELTDSEKRLVQQGLTYSKSGDVVEDYALERGLVAQLKESLFQGGLTDSRASQIAAAFQDETLTGILGNSFFEVYTGPTDATTAAQIEKVAVLDILSLQLDRTNPDNLLVTEGRGAVLTPIDQGNTFPDLVSAEDTFGGSSKWKAWSTMDPASKPLSAATRDAVAKLKPDALSHMLRSESAAMSDSHGMPALSDEAILLQEMSTRFLQALVNNNKDISLKDIEAAYWGDGAPFHQFLGDLSKLQKEKGACPSSDEARKLLSKYANVY